MTADRDYFAGCHNVPLFDIGDRGVCVYCGKPLAYIGIHEDNSPAAMRSKCWGRYVDHDHPTTPSLADVVEQVCGDGVCWCHDCDETRLLADNRARQLTLPAELLPIPAGEMFS